MKQLTQSQQLMVDDGLPIESIMSTEERKQWWEKNPPTAMRLFSSKEELPQQLPEVNMLRLTTNTRGKTVMAINDAELKAMSMEELVKTYNKLAESTTGKDLKAKTVTKFSDLTAGIKKVESLSGSIKARQEGLAGETKQKGKVQATEKEKVMSKKASNGKKASAPTKMAKKGEREVKSAADKICVEIGTREGSNKELLLRSLFDNFKKKIPTSKLIKSIYGKDAVVEDIKGAFNMVLGGLENNIKNKKLPYKIEKEKVDKEITIGLYPATK